MSSFGEKMYKYKGTIFYSKADATWAAFFDECGAKWEYRPICENWNYIPSFVVYNVESYPRNGYEKLYIDVYCDSESAKNNISYYNPFKGNDETVYVANEHPLYSVLGFPGGFELKEADEWVESCWDIDQGLYSFLGIDGDSFGAYPGVGADGKFWLFGQDSSYLSNRDSEKTLSAFSNATFNDDIVESHEGRPFRKLNWDDSADAKEKERTNQLKPIETWYKGCRFRSRLEARWAVFFDACGVEWEYEPEGYVLDNGMCYLPDFLLHGVTINHGLGVGNCDIYAEIKGKMTSEDSKKIISFVGYDESNNSEIVNPTIVLGNIPYANDIEGIDRVIFNEAYASVPFPRPFNFETIDYDYFAAYPGVGDNGKFQLFGNDESYLSSRDDKATLDAYHQATSARFEHGEKPIVRRVV